MAAERLLDERRVLTETSFIHMRVWRTPAPVRGSTHSYKYSLAYVVDGECVLRFDNEAGKGDHRHIAGVESAYAFATPEKLIEDFLAEVRSWPSR